MAVTKVRRGKPRQSEERGLSLETVVTAALAAIDRVGLDAFSVRSLAQMLQVYPTAIYWYVPNRNALLAHVVKLALREVMPETDPRDWEAFLTELFRRYRAAVKRHPNIAPLIGAQLVSNAGVDFTLVDRIIEALEHAGFAGDKLLAAFDVVIAAKVGFVTVEFANLPAEDALRWAETMRETVDALDRERYPHLHRHKVRLKNRHFILRWENGVTVPLDKSFEAYVYATIQGLRQLLVR
jgi:AcrR family transcriptional regulator